MTGSAAAAAEMGGGQRGCGDGCVSVAAVVAASLAQCSGDGNVATAVAARWRAATVEAAVSARQRC